jgi:hypothetical protein
VKKKKTSCLCVGGRGSAHIESSASQSQYRNHPLLSNSTVNTFPLSHNCHCFVTTENRVCRQAAQQSSVAKQEKQVFTTRSKRDYIRWANIEARERERPSPSLSATSHLKVFKQKFVCIFGVNIINIYITFYIFTAVTVKKIVFWGMALCR